MSELPDDATDVYVESVRDVILEFDPTEVDVLDEDALKRAAAYLWWNGYKDNSQERYTEELETGPLVEHVYEDGTGVSCTAYFVYDVLKWVEANT